MCYIYEQKKKKCQNHVDFLCRRASYAPGDGFTSEAEGS